MHECFPDNSLPYIWWSHDAVDGDFLQLQEDEKECKPASQFLNLYSASEVGDEANLDIVARKLEGFNLIKKTSQITSHYTMWQCRVFLPL